MKKYFLFIILCIGLTSLSWSAVLNVPGSFSTISAACVAAVSGDTILVASGTYPTDAILIDSKSLAIIGQGTRPIVGLVKNWDASPSGGVGTYGAVGIRSSGTPNPMNVYLENLTLIPSMTDPSATRARWGIEANSGALAATDFTININLTDILLCPNDGSNNPVTTDGLSFVAFDPLVALPFRDDGIWIYGNTNLYMTRVIISNNRPTGSAGAYASADGLVYVPDFSTFTCQINEGCVISYNDRCGVQLATNGCDYLINGSDASRVLFLSNGYVNKGNADIADFAGAGTPYIGSLQINNCNVISPNQTGLLTIFDDNANIPLSVTSCLFSSGTANVVYAKDCIFLDDGGTNPLVFEHVSILVNDTAAAAIITGNYGASSPKDLTLSDVVIAGQGATGINHTEPGTITVTYTDLDTVGLNALATITTGSAANAIVLGTGVIYADPQFASIDPANPNFLNVTNFAFSAAGPGGTPLTGGARYTGTLPLILAPSGATIRLMPGATRDFTASGGTNNFFWTLSNATVGYLSATTGATVTFTAASAGTVDITVSDPGLPLQTQSATINVTPTSAPLYKDAESKKYIRFELFE